MWKSIKQLTNAITQRRQRREALEFQNHDVQVEHDNYLVCRAVVPDIPEMITLEQAIFHGHAPWSAAQLERELNDRQHYMYLAFRHDDRLVAFAGCRFDLANGTADITRIAILPQYLHRGVGERLIRGLTQEAQQHGCRQIKLTVKETNTDEQHRYARVGFGKRRTVKNYYKLTDHEAEDAVEMQYDKGDQS